jgi:8-oxo-dGTP pyrophosphatase MutT (NUDIX family)
MFDFTPFDEVEERSLVRCLIADSRNGETLVLRRGGNETFGVGEWEILQGSRDQGENGEEACYREIEEEIGVDVRPLVDRGSLLLFPVSTDKFALAHPRGHAEDWVNINYLLIGHRLREQLGELTLDADHSDSAWVPVAQAQTLLGDSSYSAAGQRLLSHVLAMSMQLTQVASLSASFVNAQPSS